MYAGMIAYICLSKYVMYVWYCMFIHVYLNE